MAENTECVGPTFSRFAVASKCKNRRKLTVVCFSFDNPFDIFILAC